MNIAFEFSPESVMRLDKLKEQTEADNYAEVIANALRLYENMVFQSKAGNRWIVKTAAGSLQPFNPWY